MLIFDKGQLGRVAGEQGFVRDTYEKVLRIAEVLRFMNADPLLSEHLVLKGGTAINLLIADMPRLSVDIDMDVVPDMPKDEMLALRKDIEEVISGYMSAEGYSYNQASRRSYSLDGLLYNYTNAGGNQDHIKIELNYSLRSHLFEAADRPMKSLNLQTDFTVRCLDSVEIYAAKANALMSRAAARDLYDFSYMISNKLLTGQEDLFRKAIIFYATISADKVNKEFDLTAMDKITPSKIRRDLFPVLRTRGRFDLDEHKRICREYLTELMKPTESEMEYMRLFESREYRPELLFEDPAIVERIRNHPMALWKCRT